VRQQPNLVVRDALHDVVRSKLIRCVKPAAAISSASALSSAAVKARDPLGLVGQPRSRASGRILRGTPEGQVSRWQCCACTHPSANMKPRALLHQSAPIAIVRAMSNAVITLPLAPSRIRSRRLSPTSVL